ncbi:hypothetical protein [Streptomyces sp. MST-110588]|uniref:hypothetical protein n=1 Tax=Streptomyces sp. MST-110588 TaxID=2833628 RepID=UPI0032421BCA
MIVVFAGRRPSAPDGQFPPACEDWLEERLDRLFAGLRPRLAIGSAAAGTDLLAAAAARKAKAHVRLLVTEDVEAFVAASVRDKGRDWEERFRALTAADTDGRGYGYGHGHADGYGFGHADGFGHGGRGGDTDGDGAGPAVEVVPLAGTRADDAGFKEVNRAILADARRALAEGADRGGPTARERTARAARAAAEEKTASGERTATRTRTVRNSSWSWSAPAAGTARTTPRTSPPEPSPWASSCCAWTPRPGARRPRPPSSRCRTEPGPTPPAA